MAASAAHLEADFTLLRSQIMGIRKRVATRYKCHLATLGHLTLGDGSPRREIWAANLSETGVGFFSDRELEAGTKLVISLTKREGGLLTLPSKVIHATQQDAGGWLIGCQFTDKLNPE